MAVLLLVAASVCIFLMAAVKHGIDTGAGVVDSDYRGLLGVVLFNFGAEDFQCKFKTLMQSARVIGLRS